MNNRSKRARAFTLTELAIVLGIIGMILGAIWTAAAKVYANNRVKTAVYEVLTVASSIRSTFSSKGIVSSTANVDLTTAGVSFGWFPSDMLQNVACPQSTANPCPFTPWNSGMAVMGNWNGGTGVSAPNYFEIWIVSATGDNGVPKADCPAFMAALVQQAASNGLNAIEIDGAGTLLISSTAPPSITNNVIVNCGGNAVLSFTL